MLVIITTTSTNQRLQLSMKLIVLQHKIKLQEFIPTDNPSSWLYWNAFSNSFWHRFSNNLRKLTDFPLASETFIYTWISKLVTCITVQNCGKHNFHYLAIKPARLDIYIWYVYVSGFLLFNTCRWNHLWFLFTFSSH
jgi:hypothetical protein